MDDAIDQARETVAQSLEHVNRKFKNTSTFDRVKSCILDKQIVPAGGEYTVALDCVHEALAEGLGCDYNLEEIVKHCKPKKGLNDCTAAATPAYIFAALFAAIAIGVSILYIRNSRNN